jgi:Type I phosphodiesterase / nucleotide pyrophosphatase
MKFVSRALFLIFLFAAFETSTLAQEAAPKRVVVLKVDGLGADLLEHSMEATDPHTGRKQLPWLNRIFAEHGSIFENFYTRGISLSAPSWSMLDTGSHLLIKGNVEYDRYTGRVYDYLNVFPFYLDYARKRKVDAPSVEVLDDAGVQLLSDRFSYRQRFRSPQLFQRGVKWPTLEHSLMRRLSANSLLLLLEDPSGGIGLDEGFAKQTEAELLSAIANPQIGYVDLFTGSLDHLAHAVNDETALQAELANLDALAGRVWNAIEASPLASQTLLVLVSDHGMNNVPGIYSQTFSLPDLLNSPAGGAHHVVTDRPQLSPYKLQGLNPMLSWVNSPSTASFYLRGQEENYPTAWLDMDGNERASVSLRNSDLNRIQILLQQLRKSDLSPEVRQAANEDLGQSLDRLRPHWEALAQELRKTLDGLAVAIRERETRMKADDHERSANNKEVRKESGTEQASRRDAVEVQEWKDQAKRYEDYLVRLKTLAALHPGDDEVLHGDMEHLIPPRSLGDANDIYDLQHYVVGPAANGFVVDSGGHLDEAKSFRYVDYFTLLASQRSRNNPQSNVTVQPIDFTATSLPLNEVTQKLGSLPGELIEALWLSDGEEHQLIELVCAIGEDRIAIQLIPVAQLHQGPDRELSWEGRDWSPGLPLELLEDPALDITGNINRGEWLSQWHTEREWFSAVHRCRYSNGVIGITEEMLPPSRAVPPAVNLDAAPRDFEILQRGLVQPDLEVFANDHWNFNVRNFNPGGNHGSFLRISTHSVWMMAGAGIPAGRRIEEPYDSLDFASTILKLLARPAPLPERAVSLSAP